jgi:hypothetical protein
MPLAPNQLRCACGWNSAAATAPQMTTDDLASQVNSLYEQHLKTKLRGARRNLAHAVEQFTRSPDDPKFNDRVDEISREVALLERELTLYQAQRRERQRQPATPPVAGDARRDNEAMPNEAFRAAQLAKAMQAIRAAGAMPQTGTSNAPAAASEMPPHDTSSESPVTASPMPDNTTKPVPVAVPPQAAPSAPPGKPCPRCGSNVSIQAPRCNCGYNFTVVTEPSSDGFLTRDELLALRRGTKHQPS